MTSMTPETTRTADAQGPEANASQKSDLPWRSSAEIRAPAKGRVHSNVLLADGNHGRRILAVVCDGRWLEADADANQRTCDIADAFRETWRRLQPMIAPRDRLRAALHMANAMMASPTINRDERLTAGASLAAIEVNEATRRNAPGTASWVSVGDARIVLVNRERVETLNEIHDSSDPADRPFSLIGGALIARIDDGTVKLVPGDTFVAANREITVVRDDDMTMLVRETSPVHLAPQLRMAAQDQGIPQNIGMSIATISIAEGNAPQTPQEPPCPGSE